MSKCFLVLVFFLLFFGIVSYAAVSATEALNFVQKENYFLSPEESAEINPNVKISYSKANYWVVSVVVDSSLNGLIAVKDEKPIALASGDITQSELFKTAIVLRKVSDFKQRASSQWILNGATSKDLSRLGQLAGNESSDLAIVRGELNQFVSLQDGVDKLNNDLFAIKVELDDASKKVSDAISFESSFFNSPNAEKLNDLKSKYFDALDVLVDLDVKVIDYKNSVVELQQGIAKTSLATENKQMLVALLMLPDGFDSLSGLSSNASSIRQEISANLFDSLSSQVNNFLSDLSTRLKKNTAYGLMNSSDKDIVSAAENNGEQFSSLKDLADYILGKDTFDLWKNRQQLIKLSESWNNAKRYFNSGSYDLAIDSAKQSKLAASAVYKDGFLETEQPGINNELLINAAIFLVVVLFVLIAFRKRKKLFSFFIKNPEEGNSAESDEVDIHGWKKF